MGEFFWLGWMGEWFGEGFGLGLFVSFAFFFIFFSLVVVCFGRRLCWSGVSMCDIAVIILLETAHCAIIVFFMVFIHVK
jgi:hypothetical protein